MKKILSIALAVVMVLSLASVAMAFNWSAPTSSLSDFNYQIDVMKFTSQTADFGSASFLADDMATAVNGAPVYFAIKLTVPADVDDDIKDNAKVDVDFTAIEGMKGVEELSISSLGKGTYYYYDGTQSFQPIEFFRANVHGMNYIAETPVYARACLDTDSAKVEAKVYSNRPLGKWFSVGGYDIGKATITNDVTLATAVTPSMTVNAAGTSKAAQVIHVYFNAPTAGSVASTLEYNFGGIKFTVAVPDTGYTTGAAENAMKAVIPDGTAIMLGGVQYIVTYVVASDDYVTLTEAPTGVGQYRDLDYSVPSDISVTVDGQGYNTTTVIEIREAASRIGTGKVIAVLPLGSNSKVLDIITSADEARAYDEDTVDVIATYYVGYATANNIVWADARAAIELLAWLDDGSANSFVAAVDAGQVYMTDSNMRTAFGFANSVSDSITWKANSTPIILDPTVSIPKTGDNASVIGFAMIMAAVVLAAVAVKKVKA